MSGFIRAPALRGNPMARSRTQSGDRFPSRPTASSTKGHYLEQCRAHPRASAHGCFAPVPSQELSQVLSRPRTTDGLASGGPGWIRYGTRLALDLRDSQIGTRKLTGRYERLGR